MARSGGSNREMQERFQRSADTISKCFHRVLDLLVSPQFYSRYVKLPSEDHTPPEIQKNPIFYPFLKDCLGAIDGTHIDAAGSPPMSLPHAHLISDFPIFSSDGKAAQPTAEFSKMHENMDLPYLWASFIWLMLVFRPVTLFWCHTGESAIISRSGEMRQISHVITKSSSIYDIPKHETLLNGYSALSSAGLPSSMLPRVQYSYTIPNHIGDMCAS
ncbi:putative DDE superfamily endonuclease [Lyophyllum shimeji]|uniref:DDE superfamily endonuclease n=1 Tax=Lyophyllum shimeji TaxID=47721 RepID=A0A9P3PYJ9_LYOSH|nr:putative DDE superfamily endonuclease [Lyophyllum shimeji]